MRIAKLYDPLAVAEKIKDTAKKNGIVIKEMLIVLNLGSNTISNLRHGKALSFDSLARIADYLDCSVDYLLGRTEIVNPPIPKDEGISDQIVNACRKLNEAGQERVALYAEDLVSSGRYQKEETLPLVARGGETIEISEPVDAESIKKADEEHPPVYPPEL